MATRTQQERDAKRKILFEKEHTALQQAEAHWAKASNTWQAKNPFAARRIECKAREAECRAARCRCHHEMLNWEEDQIVVDDDPFDNEDDMLFDLVSVPLEEGDEP